jgi:hypothetical protein
MATYQLAPVVNGRAEWARASPIDDLHPLPALWAKRLTGRQRDILACIRAHVARDGYPPTQRQIAKAVGLSSVSSVHHQLAQLDARGALRRRERSVRGLRLDEGAPAGDDRRLRIVPGELL